MIYRLSHTGWSLLLHVSLWRTDLACGLLGPPARWDKQVTGRQSYPDGQFIRKSCWIGDFLHKTKQKLTPCSPQQDSSLPSSSSVSPPQDKQPLPCSACSDMIPELRFCQHSWDYGPRLHLFVDVGLRSVGSVSQAPSMDISIFLSPVLMGCILSMHYSSLLITHPGRMTSIKLWRWCCCLKYSTPTTLLLPVHGEAPATSIRISDSHNPNQWVRASHSAVDCQHSVKSTRRIQDTTPHTAAV